MRMADRDFTELDLRRMLEWARVLRPDVVEGGWIMETRHQQRDWDVVVEADWEDRRLVVITAYSRTSARGA